jgi:diguanylate cyclase (GGDEF)-like protein
LPDDALARLAAQLRAAQPRLPVLAWGRDDLVRSAGGALGAEARALLRRAVAQPGWRVRDGALSAEAWRFDRGAWLAMVDGRGGDAGDPDPARDEALAEALEDWRQLGSALLERADLRDAVERSGHAERLQSALYAIAELASSPREMPEMLRGLHRIVASLMYAENFYIALRDPARETLRFLYFADTVDPDPPRPDQEWPLADMSQSMTAALIRQREAIYGSSEVVRQRLGLARDHEQQGPDSLDWLGVPLTSGEEVRGAIVVQAYHRPDMYGPEQAALLAFVARHILTALERKQHLATLEHRVKERTLELLLANEELTTEVAERKRAQLLQGALFRIAELAAEDGSTGAFYAEVHAVVGALLDARNFFIALLDPDGEHLSFAYSVDEYNPVRPRRRLARGLTEYLLRTGRPLLAHGDDIAALEASGEVRSFGERATSWLGVPLLHDGRPVGAVVVQSYTPDVVFGPEDQELLGFASFHIASGLQRKQAQERLLAAYAELEQRVEERTRELAAANRELRGQVAERERAERRLTHQALHDDLTGLPNRARLLEVLTDAIAAYRMDPRQRFAVLFLDLDRFKVVNDSVGHLAGDELLKHAARRISAAVRPRDVVARLGGDEFAVLVAGLRDDAEAREIAGRVLEALAEPVVVAGRELVASASIGIAMCHPGYRQPQDLLRDADAAMYRAKGAGRGCFDLFDEALRERALRQLDLEAELRQGLASDAFSPHFQPIVRLIDGAVVGFEALLRWDHPRDGLLSPGDFLEVAEESGLIEPIDWLLFEQALATRPPGGYVCINVSPRHFHKPGLAERLLALRDRLGLGPGELRVEITEGALLDDAAGVRDTLDRLRAAGVLAQLDDFGTGYSSLGYLRRFPIGSLKIDRSFVAALDAPEAAHEGEALVRAILALSASLGLDVVAEGVETVAQRDRLIALGCRYAQGYLFSRPRPAGAFAGRDARHFPGAEASGASAG